MMGTLVYLDDIKVLEIVCSQCRLPFVVKKDEIVNHKCPSCGQDYSTFTHVLF